jgi:hypothetical protein
MDKGPIKATTFSLVNPGPLPEYAFKQNVQQVNAFVQEAVASTAVSQRHSDLGGGQERDVFPDNRPAS